MTILVQIAIASAMIVVCVIVTVIFIAAAVACLTRIGAWFTRGNRLARAAGAVAVLTLWMLGALSTCVWLWAILLVCLDLFATMEAALYFSATAFTTLGFGDITLPRQWRLLSGFEAACGLILFSLNTGFLIDAMARFRDSLYQPAPANIDNRPDPSPRR